MIGTPAVEALITALNDQDMLVRIDAAEALGKMQDARAVQPLIEALKVEDATLRSKAKDAPVMMGAPAVKPLITALKHQDPDVRGQAAEILGTIRAATAVEPLIEALKDEDGFVQSDAADALGKIGAPAVDQLIPLLDAPDRNVRYLAARALGQTKDARAVEPLIAVIKDKDSGLQETARDMLVQIARPCGGITDLIAEGRRCRYPQAGN